MYCKHCGKEIDKDAAYCSYCGGKITESFNSQPIKGVPDEKQNEKVERPKAPVTFGKAINNYFTKMFEYNGRSVRSEYWWIFLLNTPIGFIFNLFLYSPNIQKPLTDMAWFLYIVYLFVSLLAGVPLIIRRMHDIGKSGSWIFIIFIPILGAIILLFMCAEDSVGDNEWGLSYYDSGKIKKDNSEKYLDAYQQALETAEHKWCCDCGAMIFTSPCPFCGKIYDINVQQSKITQIDDGFKKCRGCGAIIPWYVKRCVCGCKSFQDHT